MAIVFLLRIPDHVISSRLVAWTLLTGVMAPLVRKYRASYSFLLVPGKRPEGRASLSRLFARRLKSRTGAGPVWGALGWAGLGWAGLGRVLSPASSRFSGA